MNTISVNQMETPYGYTADYLIIDGVPLPVHLETAGRAVYDRCCESVFGMYPAWAAGLVNPADRRFIWKLIEQEEQTVPPVLICPDDLDLSCSVYVALVRKDRDVVYWDKIGYICHDRWNRKEEAAKGILYLEAYTDEDWLEYGDNIATETLGSSRWNQWISENWYEEEYRRRMNYTLAYYRENAVWVKEAGWVFSRAEYERCVAHFRELIRAEEGLLAAHSRIQ